jgi:tetratricopeptide (TPR) repeat protein
MNPRFLYLILLFSISASADIVDNAKKLIKNNQFKDAYYLLSTKEKENIDNSEYNYQLGVSALRSGHHSEALYALDRVLSENPSHIGAQLDMAIAYFHIGNLEFAEQEFKKILDNYKSQAPKIVVTTINSYLGKIKQKNKKITTTIIGSVDAGYSNNINSGIDGNSVYIPLLDANSSYAQKISSSFTKTQIIASQKHKLDRKKSLNIALVVNHKHYTNNSEYDSSNIIITTNGKFKEATESYTYGLTGIRSYLDNEHQYDMLSTDIGKQYAPSKSQSYGVKIKYGQLRFVNSNSQVNNSNKTTLTLNHSDLISNNSIGLALEANLGKTTILDSTNSNGNNSFKGFKATFKKTVNGGILSTSMGYQQDDYAKTNSMFLTKRKDKISSASIKFLKSIEKNLILDLGVSYRKQKSNIAIYVNDKATVSIGIKRTF